MLSKLNKCRTSPSPIFLQFYTTNSCMWNWILNNKWFQFFKNPQTVFMCTCMRLSKTKFKDWMESKYKIYKFNFLLILNIIYTEYKYFPFRLLQNCFIDQFKYFEFQFHFHLVIVPRPNQQHFRFLFQSTKAAKKYL